MSEDCQKTKRGLRRMNDVMSLKIYADALKAERVRLLKIQPLLFAQSAAKQRKSKRIITQRARLLEIDLRLEEIQRACERILTERKGGEIHV